MNISEIKTAYLTGDQSLTALAEQAGMSRKTLARQAQAEGWQAARAAYRQEMTDALLSRSKAQALQQDADAPAPQALRQAADQACNFLRQVVLDQRQRYAEADASGFAAADLRSLRDLTASIKELAVLLRDLDGGTREERTIHVCFAGGTEDCTS